MRPKKSKAVIKKLKAVQAQSSMADPPFKRIPNKFYVNSDATAIFTIGMRVGAKRATAPDQSHRKPQFKCLERAMQPLRYR